MMRSDEGPTCGIFRSVPSARTSDSSGSSRLMNGLRRAADSPTCSAVMSAPRRDRGAARLPWALVSRRCTASRLRRFTDIRRRRLRRSASRLAKYDRSAHDDRKTGDPLSDGRGPTGGELAAACGWSRDDARTETRASCVNLRGGPISNRSRICASRPACRSSANRAIVSRLPLTAGLHLLRRGARRTESVEPNRPARRTTSQRRNLRNLRNLRMQPLRNLPNQRNPQPMRSKPRSCGSRALRCPSRPRSSRRRAPAKCSSKSRRLASVTAICMRSTATGR